MLRLLDAPVDGIPQPSPAAATPSAMDNNPLVQLATNNTDPGTGRAATTDAPPPGALANLYDPANPLPPSGSQSTQPLTITPPSAPAAGYIRVWDPTTDSYNDYSVSGSGYIPVTPNSVFIHSDGTVETPQIPPGSLTIPDDAPGLRFFVPPDYTPPTSNFLYPGADAAPAGTTPVAQASGGQGGAVQGSGAQSQMVAAADPTVASPPSLLSPTPLSQQAAPLTAPQASPQLLNPAPLSTTPAPLAAPLVVANVGPTSGPTSG
jgi:hypothetical protein